MALRDPNLMSLLLAYSASHRARLLKQPEPATRIALWVQDIFPALRHALDDPNGVVSLSSLAAAIMLASLEIISPKAFGVEVSWRQHLETARQLIAARGGWKMMNQDQSPVTNFLLRWFAYLDVVGGLVGGAMDLPSSHAMAMEIGYQVDDRLEEDRIDCLFGFTTRCITILAKIADLARMCSRNRLDPDYNLGRAWEPSETIKEQADMLIRDTEDAMVKTSIKPCPHLHANGEAADQWDNVQITAVNDAFHWAGLIHLHRRVLGKASSHPDVQKSVRAILGTLFKVKRGSTAEACLLFPMFTAGCDAEDENHKAIIMDRLTGAGEFGMSQAHKARKLMELVWETGKPWERLVAGEFVG
ncbi:MAG: hypothetical protein M1818_001216 [Claussenomyces sp. TS43310]|nr:MAG: hypothetical protein M1818_001216 [Claussenomyces sp. TS43310]